MRKVFSIYLTNICLSFHADANRGREETSERHGDGDTSTARTSENENDRHQEEEARTTSAALG